MHGENKKQRWKSVLPECQPQTRVLSAGYDPELSEMSVKVPIFPTSTFLFKTAEDGEMPCLEPIGIIADPGESVDIEAVLAEYDAKR